MPYNVEDGEDDGVPAYDVRLDEVLTEPGDRLLHTPERTWSGTPRADCRGWLPHSLVTEAMDVLRPQDRCASAARHVDEVLDVVGAYQGRRSMSAAGRVLSRASRLSR